MTGGDGNDYLNGGEGDDDLHGGNGTDTMDGCIDFDVFEAIELFLNCDFEERA